jgi:hypothetical protein
MTSVVELVLGRRRRWTVLLDIVESVTILGRGLVVVRNVCSFKRTLRYGLLVIKTLQTLRLSTLSRRRTFVLC